MRNKKTGAFLLCVFLIASLAACSGSDVQKAPDDGLVSQNTQETSGTGEEESQEELNASEETGREELNASEETGQEEPTENVAMTDEELLEALGDNIHVVADDSYAEMVTSFLEHTDDYVGQLYQLTGSFVKKGEDPYLSREINEGEVCIPLTCLTKEPAEGETVRITGIVNYGEIAGETVPVLDVAVLENLDQEKQ